MRTVFCKDILEIVCEFGWGVRHCNLAHELSLLIPFRRATPPSCVKPVLSWEDGHFGFVLNPWHRGMPYTPLALIARETPYERLGICARQISRYLFRDMNTYWGVFKRHSQSVAHGSPAMWNKFITSIWAIKAELPCPVGALPHNRLMLILSEAGTAELLPRNFSQPWHETA